MGEHGDQVGLAGLLTAGLEGLFEGVSGVGVAGAGGAQGGDFRLSPLQVFL
jgi:hypothetical protein